MKKTVLIFLFGFQIFVYGQIEFSGFFDILYQRNLTTESNLGFGYGQFELDISLAVSHYIQIADDLEYNPDKEKVEQEDGFIDFHLFSDGVDHPVRGKSLTHSGVLVGEFDFPFGIDYLSIPSPDRKLVSAPLLNERTFDCWNYFGLNIYGAGSKFNFTGFSVNGVKRGAALGDRIGFTSCPIPILDYLL